MASWSRKKTPIDVSLAAAAVQIGSEGVADAQNDPRYRLFAKILTCKSQTDAEAGEFAAQCRQMDNLYRPEYAHESGPSHWGWHESAQLKGRNHVSLNDPPIYVDFPATIQAMVPDIDYVPESQKPEDQEAADRREKLFWAWWEYVDMESRLEDAAFIRALYGRGIVVPHWDEEAKLPGLTVVESPENVRVGWGSSDFKRKDWALYIYSLTPQAIQEEFDLDVRATEVKGQRNIPVVFAGSKSDAFGLGIPPATRSQYEQTQIEVYDFWYKTTQDGKTEVRHAVYVGNCQVSDEAHDEFDEVPYIWIANGRIAGRPDGKPELYDLQSVFSERDEKTSVLGQIVGSALNQKWQLISPPDSEPADTQPPAPATGEVKDYGPGKHVEAITPYLPEYQANQYLDRLDTALARMSGLNEILLSIHANPAASSQALRLQVSMYLPRIKRKRQMLYQGMLIDLWRMTAIMWERKDPRVKAILKGHYAIEITPPEIIPLDNQEQMNRIATGVQNSLISTRRGQTWLGIKNVTEEMTAIMAEKTNAALYPANVMQQIQLIAASRQLNIAPDQSAQQGGEAIDPALADLAQRRAAAAQMAQNRPPEGGQSANTPAAANPSSTPTNAQADNGAPLLSQTMQQGGKVSGRLLSSTPIGGNG